MISITIKSKIRTAAIITTENWAKRELLQLSDFLQSVSIPNQSIILLPISSWGKNSKKAIDLSESINMSAFTGILFSQIRMNTMN